MRLGARAAAAALVAALLLFLAGSAEAADRGTARLVVGGAAADRLGDAGVRIGGGARRLTLPVRRAVAGTPAVLRLGGSLKLSKGRESVALRQLRLALRAKSIRVTAVFGETG